MANEKVRQTPVITWKIVRRCSPYNPNSKRCYLCLNEKLKISKYRGNNLLNKKTELISRCRHQNKCTLSKYDSKDCRLLYCKKPLYCNFYIYIVTFRLLIIFGWRLLVAWNSEYRTKVVLVQTIIESIQRYIYIYIYI